MNRHVTAFLALLALSCGLAWSQDATARPIAINVKRAFPVSGAPIDDAVIVIEGGKITAIGPRASVDVPEEADVLEAEGMYATPGFVHPVSLAMGPSGNYDVSGRTNGADRLAADDLVPTWPAIRTLAKAGFTRVNVIVANGGFAGQSVLIKPIKKLDRPIRREDVIANKDVALSMAFEPRTTNKTFWKETLAKVKKYREDRAAAAAGKGGRAESGPSSRPSGAESKPGDESKPASRPSEPAQDPKVTPIADLFDAKMPGILVISSAAALLHLLPIIQEYPEFKPSLYITEEAWRVVDQVKKLGVAAILSTGRVNRPDTNIELVPVRDFVDAGIAVALVPELPFSQNYEGFTFHLAELARKGVARDQVLRAVTLTPAELLGIQKEVGSLEKGKAGDVLLWTADPLSPDAGLARVIVGGVTVYEEKAPQ